MTTPMRAAPEHSAPALAFSWKQPVMALLACLLFGPIFAAPLVALMWIAASALRLAPLGVRIAEISALAMAAAPTAWLAMRGWRVEGRMAAGLEP